MADHISDISLDFMAVPLTSELNYFRKLGSNFLDEIQQIVISSVHQSESLKVEGTEFAEDFNAFTSILTLDDWATNNQCIEELQDQPEGDNKVENVVQCGFEKERQRHTNSCSETSSSGSLKLKLRLIKKSEDVKTWSVAENISNDTSSTTKTPASCAQSDIPPTVEKQRMKVDSEQLEILNKIFAASPYIVGKKRRILAEYLGVPEKQVGYWFEYRRRRMRLAQSGTSRNQKAVSARSGRPLKNTDTSFTVKREPFDVIVSTTSARHPKNVDASFAVKPELSETFVSKKLTRLPNYVDTSSKVKPESDPFVSSAPNWQPKYGDAPSSVKRNSFDTIPACSSNASTAWGVEDSQSPNHENEFNSFGSRMALEIPSSEQSVSSEDISSWPGNLEENENFSYPHAAGEDYNLLSVMGLENMCPNINTLSQFE